MSVQLILPQRHSDSHGWFTEVYNRETFARLGVNTIFVQENHSLSVPRFILRGLHFQTPDQGQDKLVRCIRDRVLDVAVDARGGSPTYGRHVAAELSAENGHQLFIPVGFAHGFLTLEPKCELSYKCSALYAPAHDGGIAWDSAGIDWPIPADPQPELSDKDRRPLALTDFNSPFAYDGTR